MKASKNVVIELTEDWHSFKKGDKLTRSRDVAGLHINQLKNAKIYVKKANKVKTKK